MGPSTRRLLETWARNAEAHAQVLAALEPRWGTEVHRVGGGWLVLSGAGLYVNRALACGLDRGLSGADLDLIVERSEAVGVDAAVEVTPATHPATVDLLRTAGFVHEPDGDVTAFTLAVVAPPIDGPGAPVEPGRSSVVVRPVASPADLRLWQETSAIGWGHVEPEARRASDAFTVAAHAVDGDGMVLAFDAGDGRPLGCASTTIRDRVATLGGMSTVPTERRRGVQTALVRHRLALAAARGCHVAAATTASGGASGRNLERLGFTPRFTIATYARRRR